MFKDLPKISIVTPSFNQAEFIEATIQSVLDQGYPNLEYIIIDGGSTDGSVEIIKKYEIHLHFWCSEPDGGQYDAINKGFTHSTGEIMAWLNSDDIYYPWTFRTVSSIMSELSQVEWLTTLNRGLCDWQGFCIDFHKDPGYSREAFLDGCYGGSREAVWVIQQESTFWRRSLWRKIDSYINTEYNFAGDFDLWSRFFFHAELYGTTSPLGGFRNQSNQKSRNLEEYAIEAEKSLNAMRKQLNRIPNRTRKMALQLKLNKIPKIRKISESLYSYRGKRVVRKNQDLPNGFWDIEEYTFS